MILDSQQINTNGIDGVCSTYGGEKLHAGCKYFEDEDFCIHSNVLYLRFHKIGEILN